MSRIIGIDVARWQGIMLWDSVVAAGVRWAWIKCTHGLGGTDGQFKANWAASRGKLPRGAYHWFTDGDPLLQAEKVVQTLEDAGDLGDCPIAVDFEEPSTVFRGNELLDRLRLCLRRVHVLSGRVPFMYTGSWYWQGYAQNLDAQDIVETYPLWLAAYPRVELRDRRACATEPPVLPKPSPPKPWADRGVGPTAWQFDGDGGCLLPNGVDADFNEYLGNDFDDFCGVLPTTLREPGAVRDMNGLPPALNFHPEEGPVLASFLDTLVDPNNK